MWSYFRFRMMRRAPVHPLWQLHWHLYLWQAYLSVGCNGGDRYPHAIHIQVLIKAYESTPPACPHLSMVVPFTFTFTYVYVLSCSELGIASKLTFLSVPQL